LSGKEKIVDAGLHPARREKKAFRVSGRGERGIVMDIYQGKGEGTQSY